MDSTARQPRRGFTLVELLVAIIILLVGVVAALRIFPPGFAAFNDAKKETISGALLDNSFNFLADNADSLPDAILPVDSSASTAIASRLDFGDLRAVSYIPGLTDSWAYAHRYTFGEDPWPLWQPLSARIPRLVIGEKVTIPSDINAFRDPNDTGDPPTPYNLARFPSYVPHFAPIEADSLYSLLVYDLRYVSGGTPADLVYVRGADSFTFADIGEPRFIRMTYSCTDGSSVVQVPPAVWRIDGDGAVIHQGRQDIDGQNISATVSGADPYTITLHLPGGWTVVPGSEQLNRAYEYVDMDNPADMQNLISRQFCLYTLPDPLPRYVGMTKTLLSMLIFSTADSGKTVKIDYVVADWGILHDDVMVDNDGYVTLTTLPRFSSRPQFPRETQPWGLLEPMTGGDLNVVMTLLHLYSNNVFSVEFDPAAKNQNLGVLEKGYQVNTLLTTGPANYKLLIDMSNVQQKRIRLGVLSSSVDDGGVTRPIADWNALAGQSFRFYYRAQDDWAVQFFRAPAEFGYISGIDIYNNSDYLGWTNYTRDNGNSIFVPGIYAGQSIAVDYQYRDLCRIINSETDSDTVQVDATRRLAEGASVRIIEPDGAVNSAGTLIIEDIDSRLKTVRFNTAVNSVPRGSFLLDENPDSTPLQRAAGEAHYVPAPDPDTGDSRASRVALQHLPAAGTVPAVRGTSVMLRALWTQPRSGEAYVVDDDCAYSFPTKIRTLNERWREKTAVINLPASAK